MTEALAYLDVHGMTELLHLFQCLHLRFPGGMLGQLMLSSWMVHIASLLAFRYCKLSHMEQLSLHFKRHLLFRLLQNRFIRNIVPIVA